MIERQPQPLVPDDDHPEGLTSIPGRIHCAATDDTNETDDIDELDRIVIENFLKTLSDVAMSITKRRESLDK